MSVRIALDHASGAFMEARGATAYDVHGRAFEVELVHLPLGTNDLVRLMIDAGSALAVHRARIQQEIAQRAEAARVAADPGPGVPRTQQEKDELTQMLRRVVAGLKRLDVGDGGG